MFRKSSGRPHTATLEPSRDKKAEWPQPQSIDPTSESFKAEITFGIGTSEKSLPPSVPR